jgi:hypothetical protein
MKVRIVFDATRSKIALAKWWVATIIEESREELVIVLVKAVKPRLKVVLRDVGAETNLPARVSGSVMIGRGGRKIS